MTTEQFTYWLHGFFEIADTNKLTPKQVQIIKDHLDLVFDKQTPNRNGFLDLESSKSTAGKTLPASFTLTDDLNRPLCDSNGEPDRVRDSKRWDLSKHDGLTRKVCSHINNLDGRGPTVYC